MKALFEVTVLTERCCFQPFRLVGTLRFFHRMDQDVFRGMFRFDKLHNLYGVTAGLQKERTDPMYFSGE